MATTNPLTSLRLLLLRPPALLGLCIMLNVIVAIVRAHAKSPPARVPTVLEQLASSIEAQYHECVPLGWFPESRPWRGYYPGYNADVAAKGVVFEAQWVAQTPARPHDSHTLAVKAVLDEFARLGLLARHELPDGFRYNLTREGERYYYERNTLGTNVEYWSYLCFSRLHAKTVAWVSRPSKGRDTEVTARIRFTWAPGADAPWATPFLKEHAVELNPTASPAVATAYRRYDDEWGLKLDFTFPLVKKPSAWKPTG